MTEVQGKIITAQLPVDRPGKERTYFVTESGTHFDTTTPPKLMVLLEELREKRIRVKIWLGDTKTGKAWDDTETGYIGRSCGPIKIPLIIRRNSSGREEALLDQCIIRVQATTGIRTCSKSVYYEHPKFHIGD